jgi:hypothetical protein
MRVTTFHTHSKIQQKLWFRKFSYLRFDVREYKENTITEYVVRGAYVECLILAYWCHRNTNHCVLFGKITVQFGEKTIKETKTGFQSTSYYLTIFVKICTIKSVSILRSSETLVTYQTTWHLSQKAALLVFFHEKSLNYHAYCKTIPWRNTQSSTWSFNTAESTAISQTYSSCYRSNLSRNINKLHTY